ncbi:hypothetical protein PINS_up009062 [Pythium insidiosum]|nr:hypothetical protein PINS_up009062 [Pythium insidiosum]
MPGRTSYKGKPPKASQHKNDAETFERKHEIVVFYDTHSMVETIDRFYPNVSEVKKQSKRRNIQRWAKQREMIAHKAKCDRTRRLTRDRPAASATTLGKEAEERIVTWINSMRKEGIPVSSQMLQLKGLEVAEESGTVGFKASWGWRKSFMERHKLSIRMTTREGQVTCADGAAAVIRWRGGVARYARHSGRQRRAG